MEIKKRLLIFVAETKRKKIWNPSSQYIKKQVGSAPHRRMVPTRFSMAGGPLVLKTFYTMNTKKYFDEWLVEDINFDDYKDEVLSDALDDMEDDIAYTMMCSGVLILTCGRQKVEVDMTEYLMDEFEKTNKK